LDSKHFADDKEVKIEERRWLRQHSKDFYSAAFNALVKQLDKCINVDGEINVFSRFEYRMFYVLHPFVIYLLTLLHT
jgi:hypothetical protein